MMGMDYEFVDSIILFKWTMLQTKTFLLSHYCNINIVRVCQDYVGIWKSLKMENGFCFVKYLFDDVCAML